jgi:hypothetical protein
MDQTLTCCDCRAEFPFTTREQEFFAGRGWAPPKRCPPCRVVVKQRLEARASRGVGSTGGGRDGTRA